MTEYEVIENYLETYSLEEILELNDLTEAEALYFLVERKFVSLPNPRPLWYIFPLDRKDAQVKNVASMQNWMLMTRYQKKRGMTSTNAPVEFGKDFPKKPSTSRKQNMNSKNSCNMIATELARQLIEQGMRSMKLLDDDKQLVLLLHQEFIPIEIVKEERMVSLELNAKKAA